MMEEDTQNVVEQEQVEQNEATQISFGQSENNDTQIDTDGQVDEPNTNTWTDDKRYGSHWGEDPNKMYESLRYHEKRQGEFDTQINDYKTQVSDLSQYKENYTNLENLFNHEQLGPQLMNVIESWQNNGNATAEPQQQQQQPTHDPRFDDIMNWKQDIEKRSQEIYLENLEKEQMGEVNKMAKEYNINFDEKEFKSYMKAENIPQEYWPRFFKSEALPHIVKNTANKAGESALKKASSNQSLGTGTSKIMSQGAPSSNLEADLVAALS